MELDKERLRPTVQLAACACALFALLFVPVGIGASPKRDLNAFHNFTDVAGFGDLLVVPLGFVAAATLLAVVSSFLPGRNFWEDDL